MTTARWLAMVLVVVGFGCKSVQDARKDELRARQAQLAAAKEMTAVATNAETKTQLTEATKTLEADVSKTAENNDALRQFAGINFGVGISLTLDLGNTDRVESASLQGPDGNKVVRVDEERNEIPRVMLETHYFFTPDNAFLGLVEPGQWGFGPFIGLQNGTDEIIDAVGAGLMIGFRRAEDSKDSFNLGVGVIVDPRTKVLGDGIEEGKPLPSGESDIRFKTTNQTGLLVMASFAF